MVVANRRRIVLEGLETERQTAQGRSRETEKDRMTEKCGGGSCSRQYGTELLDQ